MIIIIKCNVGSYDHLAIQLSTSEQLSTERMISAGFSGLWKQRRSFIVTTYASISLFDFEPPKVSISPGHRHTECDMYHTSGSNSSPRFSTPVQSAGRIASVYHVVLPCWHRSVNIHRVPWRTWRVLAARYKNASHCPYKFVGHSSVAGHLRECRNINEFER